ncbi:hypothetical protein [Protaetiibacter larvae]|uniref:LPXTG cell wall anchor domain-containing protein n=1 Tax=Protaetiibacter larvae TaxID=2592654 RepID=A0A5C1Y715_9MICO|nr:hypothetical protein [Protaetiibacter larvae]QEO09129.1 hypothetical protein FLP23_03310 [Protaetiibacter larvae]
MSRAAYPARPLRTAGAAALAAGVLLAAAPVPAFAASSESCAAGVCTVTFTTPSAATLDRWTVPAGVASVTVELYGANSSASTGAAFSAVLAVSPGDDLAVFVGTPGLPGSSSNLGAPGIAGTFVAGGAGGAGGASSAGGAGGAPGASAGGSGGAGGGGGNGGAPIVLGIPGTTGGVGGASGPGGEGGSGGTFVFLGDGAAWLPVLVAGGAGGGAAADAAAPGDAFTPAPVSPAPVFDGTILTVATAASANGSNAATGSVGTFSDPGGPGGAGAPGENGRGSGYLVAAAAGGGGASFADATVASAVAPLARVATPSTAGSVTLRYTQPVAAAPAPRPALADTGAELGSLAVAIPLLALGGLLLAGSRRRLTH